MRLNLSARGAATQQLVVDHFDDRADRLGVRLEEKTPLEHFAPVAATVGQETVRLFTWTSRVDRREEVQRILQVAQEFLRRPRRLRAEALQRAANLERECWLLIDQALAPLVQERRHPIPQIL